MNLLQFPKRSRPLLMTDRQTATVRVKQVYDVGEVFMAFGRLFRVTAILKCSLQTALTRYYDEEGFESPEDFSAFWAEQSPVVRDQVVFVHEFVPVPIGV
jgi:hypothetical protein